jgi:hypothetical protein
MATTIKLKNSVTTTNAPSSLAQGEVAINVTDKKVWVGNAATTPVQLLGTGSDGSLSTLTVGAGTVSAPAITTAGDTNTGIFFPAADTIAFTEGGTESMRITSAGDVGIGTSSPTNFGSNFKMLAVQGSDFGVIQAISNSGSTTLEMMGSSGIGYVGTRTNHPVAFRTNDTERMRIDSSGNVGIGTSSPLGRLALGSLVSNQVLSMYDDGTNWYGFGISSNNFQMSAATGASITFNNITRSGGGSLTERMRIDSSGNLLVGATAPPFSNANFADGSTYVNGNAFINNSSGTSQYNVRFDGYSDQLFVVWSNGNTQSNSIYYAYGGTAWVNSSDEALKDIIEPITNAVDKVSQLRSVIGKYKTEEEGARHPFLIAQDVQKVLPEAVYLNKSRVEGEPDTLGVGYTDVIPLLVAAIQEQQAIITDLKSRIEALESK